MKLFLTSAVKLLLRLAIFFFAGATILAFFLGRTLAWPGLFCTLLFFALFVEISNQSPIRKWLKHRFDTRKHPRQNRATITDMTGYQYEEYVARKMRAIGFRKVVVTPKSGDYGADVIGKHPKGFQVCVQCKKYQKSVGIKAVQEIYAAKSHYNCRYAVVVTNSSFTQAAIRLAQETGVVLIDQNRIQQLLMLKS